MGRPSIKFSEEKRKTIKAMAGYGIPQKDIARVHGVSEKTLRLHCEHELATGATEATTKVAETLFGLATGGNVTACIFWMKTRAGWTERTELTGKGGKDLMPAGKISLEDRADAGKRLAFLLAVAAHEQNKEVAVQVDAGSMESLTPGTR